jgi:hypothetical protein
MWPRIQAPYELAVDVDSEGLEGVAADELAARPDEAALVGLEHGVCPWDAEEKRVIYEGMQSVISAESVLESIDVAKLATCQSGSDIRGAVVLIRVSRVRPLIKMRSNTIDLQRVGLREVARPWLMERSSS